ncbi:hypothetical protein MIZ03_4580 [Rhodoferax lithotrophicus]|uniref:NlpC/P60 domain-containing protein n=1 Tax=Rhodoferax lithotrophicus TaxID=2798804 RepID=A0ABM7MTC4_9BURK|nr:C40 family peptidase [Rhodoferax sp. MIZ03]BCO29656.1 hypothetical protein MIZ03_4580 [Rhodoferax sp. MIZ03]
MPYPNLQFFSPRIRPVLYGLGLTWAVSILVACGSAPVRAPFPSDSSLNTDIVTPVTGRLSPEQANDVTLAALGLVGTPYRYGANTPETGFDCSGLINYVYQTRASITPPRTTADLTFWGQSVPKNQLRAGDLVLFGKSTLANHAGIYVGGDRFVHAPSTGGMVRLESLDARHWLAQKPRFKRP